MAGNNGQAYTASQTLVMPEVQIKGDAQANAAPAPNAPRKRNIALDLLPFTSVPFEGEDAIWAWGRLLLYGAVAYATWKPARTVSYVAMGAAGMSLLTSLSRR